MARGLDPVFAAIQLQRALKHRASQLSNFLYMYVLIIICDSNAHIVRLRDQHYFRFKIIHYHKANGNLQMLYFSLVEAIARLRK